MRESPIQDHRQEDAKPEQRERSVGALERLDLALEYGCYITIDTDAHSPGQLEWQHFGCEKAVQSGVPVERIMNTWSCDELLEWAGRS